MKEMLEKKITESLKDLIEHDGELFSYAIDDDGKETGRKLHEVCINHQFSIHLANHIVPLLNERNIKYYTDIEFNRNKDKQKAITVEHKKENPRPDIIIHNRKAGAAKSNFLVVECKKEGCSEKALEHDTERIIQLMSINEYAYEFGLKVLYKGNSSIAAEFFWHEDNGITSKNVPI
jgi:hypothetical protein